VKPSPVKGPQTIIKNQRLTEQTGQNKQAMTIRETNEMIRTSNTRKSEFDFQPQTGLIGKQKTDQRKRHKSRKIAMTSERDRFDLDYTQMGMAAVRHQIPKTLVPQA
jgi:hypothetical protein